MKLMLKGEENEPQVVPSLVKMGTGVVRVYAENAVHRSYLAEITPDGLYLLCGVAPQLGFPLDDRGRIRVIK